MLNSRQQQLDLLGNLNYTYSKFSMAAKLLKARHFTGLTLHQRTPFVNSITQTACSNLTNFVRWYAKKKGSKRSDCRIAKSDIPPEVNPECSVPCALPRKKRPGILHWLKLKVVEGGTNFGS